MTERLTEWDDGLVLCPLLEFDSDYCTAQDDDCPKCELQKQLQHLGAYEDTGMTPEQLIDLARAKEEGRIMPKVCGLCADFKFGHCTCTNSPFFGMLVDDEHCCAYWNREAAEAEKERLEHGKT